MAVIDKDRKQMTVKRNDTDRVFVFISKCKCCCQRFDLGHKGVSSSPEYGCGDGQESPELVLDA